MSITLELSDLVSFLNVSNPYNLNNEYVGQYVIARTYSAGVHVGKLEKRNGLEVKLSETQRLWEWYEDVEPNWDAGALTGVAIYGVNKKKTKISEELESIVLTEVIELLPLSKKAISSIKDLKGWSY